MRVGERPLSEAIGLARVSVKGGFNLFWGVAASSIISALGVILVARILSPSEYNLVAIALIAKFIFSHSGNNISGKNEH